MCFKCHITGEGPRDFCSKQQSRCWAAPPCDCLRSAACYRIFSSRWKWRSAFSKPGGWRLIEQPPRKLRPPPLEVRSTWFTKTLNIFGTVTIADSSDPVIVNCESKKTHVLPNATRFCVLFHNRPCHGFRPPFCWVGKEIKERLPSPIQIFLKSAREAESTVRFRRFLQFYVSKRYRSLEPIEVSVFSCRLVNISSMRWKSEQLWMKPAHLRRICMGLGNLS